MMVNVVAGIATLVLSVIFLRQLLPVEAKAASAEYAPRLWLKAAFPMLVYGGAQIILSQTDIVMLGAMRSAHEVGLYTAANRLAYLMIYITYATEIIMAPVISRLYANGEIARLQQIITKAVNISFIIVLPFSLLLFFVGRDILRIFGHEFMTAEAALNILVFGHLIEVILGSGALLLGMAKSEHIVAITFSIMAATNVVLNYLLIPTYGLNGAAVSSMVSLILAKLFFTIYVAKKQKIYMMVMGNYMNKVNCDYS
jgi:O-antigen/teichoic acid export membrane protein